MGLYCAAFQGEWLSLRPFKGPPGYAYRTLSNTALEQLQQQGGTWFCGKQRERDREREGKRERERERERERGREREREGERERERERERDGARLGLR